MKQTAIAPSNIAFIKYWGKKDEALRLPANANISMNLTDLLTTTTVDFSSEYLKDDILINGQRIDMEEKRVIKQLDLIRKRAGISLFAKVVTENNFPASTGLSSSASGFAALTVAACASAGLNATEKSCLYLRVSDRVRHAARYRTGMLNGFQGHQVKHLLQCPFILKHIGIWLMWLQL
jgi:diphosphomevalonate decarboxylase